jgi:hypothetical protein
MTNFPEKERLARQYDFEEWAKQTDVGKRILIWNFFMGGNEIPGWELIKTIPKHIHEYGRVNIYIWHKVEGASEELIRIDVTESNSWHLAHERLLKELNECQAPQLPKATSRGIEIGDVAFVGFGEPVQSVVFARVNLVVSIDSIGRQEVPIVDTAKRIDELFITRPQASKEGVIPQIESFSSEKEVIGLSEMVPLNIKAKDPLHRPLWYKLIIDQGELFMRDEKVCYSSNTQGQSEISLFAINENGFIASTTLTIRIE